MASDFAESVPAELESSLRLKTVQYFVKRRPWLDLYGITVRPVAPFGSVSRKPYVDSALIRSCLLDELLFEVFVQMSPYDLGRAYCVCRKWRYTIRNPVFWRHARLKAWQLSGMVENYKILQSRYEGSWRKMWLLRPRIYTDDCVFGGHYILSDDKVEAAVLYPSMRPTVLRIRLRLRGTTAGASDRMDLLSLVTSGVNDCEANGPDEDILEVVEGWQDDETHNPDVPAVSHKRGLTPFVFVPFEEGQLYEQNAFSALKQGRNVSLEPAVDKMHYFVPG